MKKIAVIIIMFLIILSGVKTENDFSLLNYFSGEYVVYTSTENEECIDLGFCYMNTKPTTENVVGESITIENLEISTALKTLSAQVVKTEYLEDGTTVIYAFTNLINEKVDVNGQKVNLQIATRDERSVIGWPLILGSY